MGAKNLSSVSPKVTDEEEKNAEIIARQDRIPIWSLSYLFIGILGIGYIFIFFDIFNINVSFIQTALTGLQPTYRSANTGRAAVKDVAVDHHGLIVLGTISAGLHFIARQSSIIVSISSANVISYSPSAGTDLAWQLHRFACQ